MKQNTSSLIIIGFVFLACGQPQSVSSPPQSGTEHESHKENKTSEGYGWGTLSKTFKKWKGYFGWRVAEIVLGTEWLLEAVLVTAVTVIMAKKIASQKKKSKLKNIENNILNPLFLRVKMQLLTTQVINVTIE